MKTLTALFIIIAMNSAWAGKFEVIGEGSATKPAEFIRLNISLLSECHTSAFESRQLVDHLTERTILALKPFEAPIPQQLQVAPEANLQTIKSEYINGKDVIICDESHSWRSSTTIQFRLNDLQQLASLQDALLKLNPATIPSQAQNLERLSLTLSKPEAGVLAETWDSMADLALQRALQNALRQVKVLTQGMNQNTIELTKVEATKDSSGQAIYDRVDSEGDTAGIGLGFVSLKLARKFTYKVGP